MRIVRKRKEKANEGQVEFPEIFILGFTEGIFPLAKTIGDRKSLGLEEIGNLKF